MSALQEHVVSQRWFGAKSREVVDVKVLETIPVGDFRLALLEVDFGPGTHELYQLAVDVDDVDASENPDFARELVGQLARCNSIETEVGTAIFCGLEGMPDGIDHVRPMGAEQSNTSLVLDERFVLKLYRRIGAGPNPELELLRFLTERDFEHVATLRGYYAHEGRLIDATLGIVQDYVGGSADGWDLALADLRSDEPMRFVARARELGAVTGKLHTTLGSDNADPAFAPEETSAEALGLLTATVDEEIENVFLDLPDDMAEIDPIRGRAQEVRERLSMMTQVGSAGRVIRHHGDYHLGQVLRSGDEDWIVLDFEGEPARTLVERRRKRSPLRDVAGMLRSFAYAATASEILHGRPAPAEWEREVREAYLESYLEHTDSSMLPPGRQAVDRLLSVFELEKAVYELRYELDNRPDWVRIPVAGIVRLLELDPEEMS